MKCSMGLTQNINESVHAKLWAIIKKSKTYSLPRYMFALYHIMNTHNWGYLGGTLLTKLGGVTNAEFLILSALDKHAQAQADTRKLQREPSSEIPIWIVQPVESE